MDLDPDPYWNQCGSTTVFWSYISVGGRNLNYRYIYFHLFVSCLLVHFTPQHIFLFSCSLWHFCLFPSCKLSWKLWLTWCCCAVQSYIYVKSPTEENAIANEILKLPNSSLEVDKPVKVLFILIISIISSVSDPYSPISDLDPACCCIGTDPIRIETKTKFVKNYIFFIKTVIYVFLEPYKGRTDSLNMKFLHFSFLAAICHNSSLFSTQYWLIVLFFLLLNSIDEYIALLLAYLLTLSFIF